MSRYSAVLLLVASLCALTVAAIIPSCSDRLVDSRQGHQLRFSIDLSQASPSLLVTLDSFHVVVIAVSSGDTLAFEGLTLKGAMVEDTIRNLPAGQRLRLHVEALSSGSVIYEGDERFDVVPNQITIVAVRLRPAVEMLKFTPRFIAPADSTFALGIQIYNVPNLFGISFPVAWDDNLLRLDSVRRGADVLDTMEIIFFLDPEPNPGYYAVAITHTVQSKRLVDAGGDAALAELFFTVRADMPGRSTNVTFDDSTIVRTLADGSTMAGPLFVDQCQIDTP